MILPQLFWEFFQTGLFAVGGGLATIPFLSDMGARTGWFHSGDLANMIAISESTPGPLGVNMATYVGYELAGVPGAVTATLGLISPSVLVILLVAAFLAKFRSSRVVQDLFYGLRPASTGLIAAACWGVISICLVEVGTAPLSVTVHWPLVLLALAVLVGTRLKPLKGLHPICWIALSALAGILFQL